MVEIGLSIYDMYEVGTVLTDPKATTVEKMHTVSLATTGLVIPGAGYTATDDIVEVVAKHGDEAVEVVEQVTKHSDEATEVGEVAAKKVDPPKQIGPPGDPGAIVTKQIPDGWTMKPAKKVLVQDLQILMDHQEAIVSVL